MISTLAFATLMLAEPAGTAVMIHGAGGGGWEYDFWKPVFARNGWKVEARDLVPEGGDLSKTTFEDYVKQVGGWQKDSPRPLILIGASMGGGIALKAAETLKPDAIILVNSVAPKGFREERETSEIPAIIRWANGPLKDTEDSMPDSDRKTILWAWKKWRDESGQVVRTLRSGIEVKKPTCPVLVIIGENDTDIPPAISRKVAEAYDADIHFYAGMSHVGPLLSTRANEVAVAAQEWADRQMKERKRDQSMKASLRYNSPTFP